MHPSVHPPTHSSIHPPTNPPTHHTPITHPLIHPWGQESCEALVSRRMSPSALLRGTDGLAWCLSSGRETVAWSFTQGVFSAGGSSGRPPPRCRDGTLSKQPHTGQGQVRTGPSASSRRNRRELRGELQGRRKIPREKLWRTGSRPRSRVLGTRTRCPGKGGGDQVSPRPFVGRGSVESGGASVSFLRVHEHSCLHFLQLVSFTFMVRKEGKGS